MIEGFTVPELVQLVGGIIKAILIGIVVIWGLLRLGGHKI